MKMDESGAVLNQRREFSSLEQIRSKSEFAHLLNLKANNICHDITKHVLCEVTYYLVLYCKLDGPFAFVTCTAN